MHASAMITLLVGFALGMKHSTEADHIAAVSTLVSDTSGAGHAARIGAWWGLGHLLTILVAGGTLLALPMRMNARIEWALELLAALVLIGLGVRTIRNCLRGRYHFHTHEHSGRIHAHLHFHPRSEPGHQHDSPTHLHTRAERGHSIRSMLVGMAHGLAGTAGLALLVLSSIPSRALGLAYLAAFGLGALAGMAAFSAVLGLPFARAAERLGWLYAMRLVTGVASGLLGGVLTYQAFLPRSLPF